VNLRLRLSEWLRYRRERRAGHRLNRAGHRTDWSAVRDTRTKHGLEQRPDQDQAGTGRVGGP
jgi:hypothetical protein